ncbi:hypothetical protein BLNAU_3988 [Blattamonas nauphoetae]|uniref:Uncharacterized protein n=1 Tax=Blattamonas nauphoetae TaxID=2049346 RepID=A0ABQ9YAW0_9EUKA|nr:hypothetical protein BLNAU_3988 [Blattamonas nauphoetae]
MKTRLSLTNAGLIPQLILTLDPLSLSLIETVHMHASLMETITCSLWLETPGGLEHLGIKDENEQQTVIENIFKQVLAPSEKWFLELLTQILQISPSYQPTLHFILDMPVFLTIPSYLTFFEHDLSICNFLISMAMVQREWKESRGDQRQMGKKVDEMLRMEGIEDVIEERLQNDKEGIFGRDIVAESIEWNTLQGMNLPKLE